jgi:hypothetical protein
VSNTLTLTLPRPHSAQRTIKAGARRFNVVCCGRRMGKTTLAVDLMDPALRGFPVAYFAPTYQMLEEVWRGARSTYAPITGRVSVQHHRLELLTGGLIDFWSLDSPDPARGRKYKRVLIDEAAMIRHLKEAWEKAIRPTLTDYVGDAWFFSTPKGLTYFWELFQLGLDPARPEWACWQIPTSANPFLPASEIEDARRDLPEQVFQQEYLAEFLADGAGVFRRVSEAATATAQAERQPGHQYVMGVDWGKLNDFTVLSVIDVTLGQQVALDRFNQLDYLGVQVPRLKALYEKFRPHAIIAEQNSIGVPVIEALVREDLPVTPFVTTQATKAAVIEGLSLAFEQSALAILPDPVQLGELRAYSAERLPSGLLRYGAPEGLHDDCVMALAFAWEGAKTSGPLLLWGADQYDD